MGEYVLGYPDFPKGSHPECSAENVVTDFLDLDRHLCVCSSVSVYESWEQKLERRSDRGLLVVNVLLKRGIQGQKRDTRCLYVGLCKRNEILYSIKESSSLVIPLVSSE